MAELALINGYDIRDKKLADANVATSYEDFETNDQVLLENSDGTYTKINKASFVQAIRQTIGTYIAQENKDSVTSPNIAVMDGNNDLGKMSASALASVLGVPSNLFRNTKINMPYIQDSLKTNVSIQNNVGFIIIMNQDGNAASSGKMTVYVFGGTWASNGDRFIKTIATEGTWSSHSVTYSSDNYIVITKNNSSLNGMILSLN